MKHSILAYFGFLFFLANVYGQTSSFTIEPTLCPDQPLTFNNGSTGLEFEWDFCTGDLESSGTLITDPSILSNEAKVGFKLIHDGSVWYGFISSFSDDSIVRLSFGNDLNSMPSVTNLGNPSGLLDGPYQMDLIEFEGIWYALVNSRQNSSLVLIEFGNGLGDDPTMTQYVELSSGTYPTQPRGLDLVKDGGDIKAIISSDGDNFLGLLNFGSSILNQPSLVQLFVFANPLIGTEIIFQEGKWHSYIVHESSIWHFDFGPTLDDDFSFTNLQLDFSYQNGTYFRTVFDNGKYYGIGADRQGQISKIDLSADLSSNTGNLIESSNYGVLEDVFFFDVAKSQSKYYVFAADLRDSEFHKITYSATCTANSTESFEQNPSSVSYSQIGQYNIDLFVSNGDDRISRTTQTVDVQLPSTAFQTSGLCASQAVTFQPSLTGQTYTWDFDNDGSPDSSLENPSFSFGTPGTYTVGLEVDNGFCNDLGTQEITLFADPPAPSFGIAGSCAGEVIQFNNITDDASYAGPLEYSWDFDGQGVSSDRDPSFQFDSPGMKTITLTSSIPGCENTIQQQIELTGPQTLFSNGSACQGEAMNFTNQSIDAQSYLWDFGDGFTSTDINPTHVFLEGGNYFVELSASDSEGCTIRYEQEVSIPFAPIPDFDYDQACTGNEGIQFTDLSTVQGADVVAWQWRVDGNVVSSEQEPLMFFDESGTRSFELMVMSTNGCTETIQRNIEILASPEVSFSSDISCESLPSSFTDNTPSQQGVVSRLWTIDGQNYAGPSANHIFDAPGDYEVSLTLTADNFCSNTMTAMVTVPEKPALDFNLSSVCTGEDIILTDASIGGDPIVSRTWKLDGVVLGNGTQALAQDVSAGSHTFELEVTTESGCSFTLEQNQVINPSPIAEFDASATYGVPPFVVNFSNESSGTSETSWLVDGVVVSTSSDFSYTFTTEGTFDVALEVTNTEGCTDLEEIEILSALPAMNLRVTDVRLTPGQNGQTVVLDLVNHGNLPIEIFDVTVKAGDDFFINERFSDFVGIGGQTSVQLSSTLQLLNSNLVCVSISSAYDDIQPDDNEACVNFTSRPILENPFPNPFDEELTVRLQMPQQGVVRLNVVNATGRMMVDQHLEDLDEGLNILRFNSFNWEKGIYLVTIYFGEESVTRRVLKF